MELLDPSNFRKLFENKPAEDAEKISYGCLMLKTDDVPDFKEAQEKILQEDLYDPDGHHGYETEPHVTIFYGFKDWEFDQLLIDKVLSNVEPIQYNVGNITFFECENYDVVKFDIESPALINLNVQYSKLPSVINHPVYHPHMTLAYVKKGLGQKYARTVKMIEMISDTCIWLPSINDIKREIKLHSLYSN